MSRIPDRKLPDARPRGGAASPLFILSLLIGAVGLAIDALEAHPPAFWIGALTGARALIGAGIGLVVVAIGHLARLGLTRRIEGGSDAGDHL
jgi:hypothetical protein